jgi:uncharacterized protein (DUF1330 family)
MGADGTRHVSLIALEVADPAGYARYRAAMAPILASYGGDFGIDLEIAKVLRGPAGVRPNRLFTLRFPDRTARDRSFADPAYRDVRAAHFTPAVASIVTLAEFIDGDAPRP